MFDSENIAWKAIPVATIVAGIAFLLVNMGLNPILYGIEAPFILQYFASLVLGTGVLVEGTLTTYIVGIVVHFILSFVFTLLIAIIVHRFGLLVGLVGGGLLGLGIYSINFYTMTLFFDWMFAIHNPLLAVSHIVFGAVAGGVYEMLDTYDPYELLEEAN